MTRLLSITSMVAALAISIPSSAQKLGLGGLGVDESSTLALLDGIRKLTADAQVTISPK